LLELYFVTKGWEPQNTSAARLRSSGGGLWFSYLISTLVIAPFYEETVMRGFLYRAFRSSYTVPASAFCVVLVVGYFHWGLLAQPLFFADLVVGAGVLCLIRERTGSTWNCTLFHAAHNASASVRWPFYLGGMLLVLPLCLRSKGTSSRVSQSP
jgi:membrane protease YdiL (CAAX protease family)